MCIERPMSRDEMIDHLKETRQFVAADIISGQKDEITRLGLCNDQISRTHAEVVSSLHVANARLTGERDYAVDKLGVVVAEMTELINLTEGVAGVVIQDSDKNDSSVTSWHDLIYTHHPDWLSEYRAAKERLVGVDEL